MNGLLNRGRKQGGTLKLKDTDGSIMSTDSAVAERFNTYFFDSGGFDQYLQGPFSQSIYLSPTDAQEVNKTIWGLKNKSTLISKIEPLKIANSCLNKFSCTMTSIINSS